MTTPETERLMPCPFCQGEADTDGPCDDGYWRIVCPCSGFGPLRRTEAEAIQAWNRRTPPPTDTVLLSDMVGIAVLFHETYERLAPQFGYETRADTKKFDPESQNGRLMIATMSELVPLLRAQRDAEICAWLRSQLEGPCHPEGWQALKQAADAIENGYVK